MLDYLEEKFFNPINFMLGVIKFMFAYTVFGAIGVFLVYAAIDARTVINTGTSLLWPLLQGGTMSESAATAMITNFFEQAYNSIPFGDLFGEYVSFHSGVNLVTTMLNLLLTGDMSHLIRNAFTGYDAFWREMAVVAIASFVLYAYKNIKDHIHTTDFSVKLGWIIASIFWVLAAFACAETIVWALDIRIIAKNRNILYIIIIATAFGLEAAITAFAEKRSVIRTLLVLCISLIFTLAKSLFAWCICFVYFNVSKLIGNFGAIDSSIGLLPSAAVAAIAILFLTTIERALIDCVKGK